MMNFSVDTKSVEYKQMEKYCLTYCDYRRPDKDFYDSMCELLAAAYLLKNNRRPDGYYMPLTALNFKNVELSKNYRSSDLLRNIIDRFPLFLDVFKNKCFQQNKSRPGFYCNDIVATHLMSQFRITDNEEISVYLPFAENSFLPVCFPEFFFDCECNNYLYSELVEVINNLAECDNVNFLPKVTSDQLINTEEVASHNYIFAMPPLDPMDSSYSTSDIIGAIVNNWTPGTQAIVLCLDSFLRDTKNARFRKYLFENHFIRKVVKMPRYAFSSIGIENCIIVLDNSPLADNTIQLTDLSSYKNIGNFSSNSFAEFENENTLTISECKYGEYILSPSFCINSYKNELELQKLHNPVVLSDLVQFSGLPCLAGSSVQRLIITNKVLAEAHKTTTIDFSSCEEKPAPAGSSLVELTEDCLLVSLIGNLNPVIFKHNPDADYFVDSKKILSLHRISDSVSDDYLVAELSKPYVEHQASLLTRGGIVYYLRSEDLLTIKIDVPSIDLQHKTVLQYKSDSLSTVAKELLALKDKEHNEYVRNLRTRKHAIGHSLADIDYSLQLIEDYIEMSGDQSLKSMIVSKSSGRTVCDCLHLMRSKLETTINQVNSLVDSQVYGIPSDYSLNDLVEEFIKKPQSPVFEYSFINAIDDVDVKVSVNKEDLFEVFQNIVDNAVKYGFDNTAATYGEVHNKITFLIDSFEIEGDEFLESINKETVRLVISNNGKPLPEGMTSEKVFTWGVCSSSGSGIGGWKMKNIIQHYGGTITLNEEEDCDDLKCDEPVYYIIRLPLR